MNKRQRLASRVVLSLVALTAAGKTAHAQTQTWLPTTAGNTAFNWNDNANWTPGPFPNAAGAAAILSTDLTAGTQIVNLNTAITIGSLTIGDANSTTNGFYNIANGTGTGSGLIFDTVSGPATLVKTTGSASPDTVSATVTLNRTLAADLRTGQVTFTGVIGGTGGINRSGSVITPAAAGNGTLTLSNNANTYTGATTIEQGALEARLTTDVLSGTNSVFGNATTAINVGSANFLPATAGQNTQTLRFLTTTDTANYTVSRGLDFSQVTQAGAGAGNIQFNGEGTGGVNTNTLTLAGDITLGARTGNISIVPQRAGMTVNITGDVSGTSTNPLTIGGTPPNPGVDGRGVGAVRFSNVNRSFASQLTMGSGTIVIDGVVGALNTASPIGFNTINLANGGATGNIVGNANFNGNAGPNDTSPDTIRSVFLDSAGSSYARTLSPGGGNSSIPTAGGYTTAVSVINGFQFGGRNTSGLTTFSGNITPGDPAVGASATNVITVAINTSLQAAACGTTLFSGNFSDTPAATTVARVTINQLRNSPNIDGINNTTLANGSDGLADTTANQLVGTAQTGTVAFTGAGTWNGTTEVLGGTFLIGGSIAGDTVTVASGATLGGRGTINAGIANSTVQVSGMLSIGGQVNPVTPASGAITSVGAFTIAKPVVFLNGSTFTLKLNGAIAATGYDQLIVSATGGISITGTNTIALTLGYAPTMGTVLTVIDNQTVAAISGNFSNLANGATVPLVFNGNTYQFAANYAGGTGNDLTLTVVAIPEPGTWAALAAGLVLVGVARARRAGDRQAVI